MRYILNEDLLTEEELETEMDKKAEERERALLFANDIFHDAGFKEESSANYISYLKEEEGYKAIFNIDTTSFNYNCYVTTEGEDSSTYSAKGTINGIEDAATKFLEAVANITEA